MKREIEETILNWKTTGSRISVATGSILKNYLHSICQTLRQSKSSKLHAECIEQNLSCLSACNLGGRLKLLV